MAPKINRYSSSEEKPAGACPESDIESLFVPAQFNASTLVCSREDRLLGPIHSMSGFHEGRGGQRPMRLSVHEHRRAIKVLGAGGPRADETVTEQLHAPGRYPPSLMLTKFRQHLLDLCFFSFSVLVGPAAVSRYAKNVALDSVSNVVLIWSRSIPTVAQGTIMRQPRTCMS